MADRPYRSFEQGGLPDRARQRVTEAAREEDHLFTTTFSVSEMAIARMAGYEPIGQVMGSSIYHLGWQGGSSWGGGEVTTLTHAHRAARDLALGRMQEEATILGAHAVVGVDLTMKGYGFAADFVEFTAVGTAVRAQGAPAVAGPPALTNLSAQDLYKLELSGYWPRGIALGNCVWYDRHCDCRSDGTWWNRSLPGHNNCIAQARGNANHRFAQDVDRLGADSAVAVTLQRRFHQHEYEINDTSHTAFRVEVLLLGTAIMRHREPRLPRPRLVLDLRGGGQVHLGRAELVRK